MKLNKDLEAVVVGLLAVVGAGSEPVGAVVHGRVAHESVLQRFVALLVPFKVADHLLLLDKHPRIAVQTVEVLPIQKKIQFNQCNQSFFYVIVITIPIFNS